MDIYFSNLCTGGCCDICMYACDKQCCWVHLALKQHTASAAVGAVMWCAGWFDVQLIQFELHVHSPGSDGQAREQSLRFAHCSNDIRDGKQSGGEDVFDLGGLDMGPWVAKGLPAAGELELVLTVTHVQGEGSSPADPT